jgi:hypothetical protein
MIAQKISKVQIQWGFFMKVHSLSKPNRHNRGRRMLVPKAMPTNVLIPYANSF